MTYKGEFLDSGLRNEQLKPGASELGFPPGYFFLLHDPYKIKKGKKKKEKVLLIECPNWIKSYFKKPLLLA